MLLARTLDKLDEIDPLPDGITVHLDAGYDPKKDPRRARIPRHGYERKEEVIDAFFDLVDAIITVRSLIRRSWTLYRWDGRPVNRPLSNHLCARALSPGLWSRLSPGPGR
jgi:hypothetical protein